MDNLSACILTRMNYQLGHSKHIKISSITVALKFEIIGIMTCIHACLPMQVWYQPMQTFFACNWGKNVVSNQPAIFGSTGNSWGSSYTVLGQHSFPTGLFWQPWLQFSNLSSPSSISFKLRTSSVPFPLVWAAIISLITLKQPGSIRQTWKTVFKPWLELNFWHHD